MTDNAAAGNPIHNPAFPRSNAYDPQWVLTHQMGPNVLWLAEWLTQAMALRPGMRVLDLGCGRALSSVFLAREFDVRVWAADLWIDPHSNWNRVREAGEPDRVFPVHLEAHALPFPRGFFDAIVSLDAYHYFGTDQLYLMYLADYLREGGEIGIVVPGLTQPFPDGRVPAHLLEPQSHGGVFWIDECASFRTAAWWRDLWELTGKVRVTQADTLPDGWRHWRDFENAVETAGKNQFPSEAEVLERDAGRYLGFARVVATRTAATGPTLYDPDIARREE